MKIIRCYLFSFSLILLLSLLCYGQEKVRKIEKRPLKNEPVELVSAEVRNKIFNSENQILADKNWLKNLKFDVKNVSDKTIVYLEVQLEIERQGKMQYPLLLPLIFGEKPLPDSLSKSIIPGARTLQKLKPNEKMRISITPSVLDQFMTEFMPEMEIIEVEKVKFFFDFIVFDDGTAWSRGRLMRRNSNGKWEDIRTLQTEISFLLSHSTLNMPLSFVKNLRENNSKFCGAMNSGFFL